MIPQESFHVGLAWNRLVHAEPPIRHNHEVRPVAHSIDRVCRIRSSRHHEPLPDTLPSALPPRTPTVQSCPSPRPPNSTAWLRTSAPLVRHPSMEKGSGTEAQVGTPGQMLSLHAHSAIAPLHSLPSRRPDAYTHRARHHNDRRVAPGPAAGYTNIFGTSPSLVPSAPGAPLGRRFTTVSVKPLGGLVTVAGTGFRRSRCGSGDRGAPHTKARTNTPCSQAKKLSHRAASIRAPAQQNQ